MITPVQLPYEAVIFDMDGVVIDTASVDEAIATEGARAQPSTVALLTRIREGGVRTALVSVGRNADAVLAAAGVGGLFDVRVDGADVVRLGLPDKPDPAVLLEAARRLGVAPARAAVVEDSAAGVEAARRGAFGLVVGVDRGDHRADLAAAGADKVIGDLGELDLGAIVTSPWLVVYEGFDPAHEGGTERCANHPTCGVSVAASAFSLD